MADTGTSNSDTDLTRLREEIGNLGKDIKNLGKDIENLRMESHSKGEYRHNIGVALALFAIGVGVEFLPAGSVGRMPPAFLAFLLYVIACLRILQAFNYDGQPKGFRKVLTNVGVSILFVGAIMLSLPLFLFFGDSTLPTRLIPYGLFLAAIGFLLIEIGIIRFHKQDNKST
jgi:hypothetical protein